MVSLGIFCDLEEVLHIARLSANFVGFCLEDLSAAAAWGTSSGISGFLQSA